MLRASCLVVLWVVVSAPLASCGGDEREGPRRELRMDFARASFWDAPFPSDDLRGGGVVDLSGVPNPAGVALVDDLLGLLDGRADGFGATSAIYFASRVALDPARLPSVHESVASGSPVFVVGIDPGSPDYLARHPIEVHYQADGGPFGAAHLLSLLPLQGMPLRPATRYAAVVLRALGDAAGAPLERPAAIDALRDGEPAYPALSDAAAALAEIGVDLDELAGLTAFRTQDGPAELVRFVDHARAAPVPTPAAFSLTETFPEFCVFESTVAMPVYQRGAPPFSGGGGTFPDVPEIQTHEDARLFITLPRTPAPPSGHPVAVMIRTGGGGDLPLVHRGPVTEPDGEFTPGEGPALHFARAGFAGVSLDGPHGGLRNITGGDEQLLIFNVTNPGAIRDNIRQSALELALLPDILADVSLDPEGCDGAAVTGPLLALEELALMGHSMGATIAPLVLAVEPRYQKVILSGAGGSWIENIVHKQSPIPIRPFAEILLRYGPPLGRALDEHDPALNFFQYAVEPADPPLYGAMIRERVAPPSVLMIQGIVDTYILPPIANATALSLKLDLARPALDADHPDLAHFTPLAELLPLTGRALVDLPVPGDVVVQYPEDDLQDGHEVVFQLEAARLQYQRFLETGIVQTD